MNCEGKLTGTHRVVHVQTTIQQLMKDKKEALTTAKEVATKLENEKKVRNVHLSPVRFMLLACGTAAQTCCG